MIHIKYLYNVLMKLNVVKINLKKVTFCTNTTFKHFAAANYKLVV